MNKQVIQLISFLLVSAMVISAQAMDEVDGSQADAAPASVFYIVFASFKDQEEAEKILGELQKRVNNPLVIKEVEIENQSWFRVTSPLFDDKIEVKENIEQIKKDVVAEAWLSRATDTHGVVQGSSLSDGATGDVIGDKNLDEGVDEEAHAPGSKYPFTHFGRLDYNEGMNKKMDKES